MVSASRRTLVSALVATGCVASLIWPAPPAAAATITDAQWYVSNSTRNTTGVSYKYTFTAATSSSLNSITMTVPAGTAGTPTVVSVSPADVAGGSVGLASNTLTYSFTAAQVNAGTAISIQIGAMTNTGSTGSYTSTITTHNGAGSVDTGTTGTAIIITATTLTSLGWTATSTTVGATGVSYTFTFTTAVLTVTTGFTMTVPPGTGGSPTLGSVSPLLLGATVSLSGRTLTVSGISLSLVAGTHVSIQVNGLTNTATADSYTSEIVTDSLGGAVSSGITPALGFTGSLNLTSPSSLTWAATLNGSDQSVTDTAAADQQLTVDDETGTAAGWHITVAATTFTTGTYTLANAGTFVLTGSVTSVTAITAPSATCVVSCTPPASTSTYPAAITTASPAATVYDASAASGLGPVTLGGSTAANPVGWWINVPASARAGTYTSTVTVAIVSGP